MRETQEKLLTEAVRQAKIPDAPLSLSADPVCDVLTSYQQWLTTAQSALAALQAAQSYKPAADDRSADSPLCAADRSADSEHCTASFTESDSATDSSPDLDNLLTHSDTTWEGE